MKINYTLLTVLGLAFCSTLSHAAKKKVLFIGNSYIYTNNMPSILQQLATSMGDTLEYDQNTPGGYTMNQHSADATTISKIYSKPWDIVVLQEQSQRPAFPPAQVAADTYPFAKKLDSMVRDNNSCTETMFFMTWGYKNGDASNCPGYPVICTYEGMQMRLRESYMQMTQDNNAVIAPVGAAFKVTRDNFSAIDLYSSDMSHPSMFGSYLEACVFYASIFHRSPVNSTYTAGLSSAEAGILRKVAERVAIDSMNKWIQYGSYPYAAFTSSVNNKTINLTNASLNATSYAWSFGDGNSSTQQSPSHTYAANGKYAVKLTASNSCFSETKTDTAVIGTTGISNITATSPLQIFNAGNALIIFSSNADCLLEVYDMNGRKQRSLHIEAGNKLSDTFIPGMYTYSVTTSSKEGSVPSTGKFIVY